ncbi:sugar ABC transporter ATP-binding protein [Tessaracoccus flavescens]|uniref:ABC transporter ATP-binding protein n=1 Tax=Tessaracoccus flavescens TaxID=399497 RepID=A0A1Q2CVF9_9ACTN|nr:sugar ABC transporter ATP-binding protein [Tessaracoccus flavescens]AQP50086.1 ABC transporter ATP-binding protein [Tessaracoccus flavescens]
MAVALPPPRRVEGTPRFALQGVSKRYGGVRAIRNADFTLMPGEVHAVVGENGAGKSTMIKIIAGAEFPDTGTFEMDGESVSIRSASDALDKGIAAVYQEAQLFGQLAVGENIFLGREMTSGSRIDWAGQKQRVVDLLAAFGLPESFVTRKVEELSAAEQQQVSIAKALSHDAKILILDEPSAILTDAEIENLFTAVRRLAAEGVSVIYISHRLDELFEIADVVTVMRDGETLGTFDIDDLSVSSLADLMVGGEFEASEASRHEPTNGEVRLSLKGLASGKRFHDVSLDVRSGEVVVLYGLVGSGVADIAAAAYGKQPVTAGSMELMGKPYSPKSASEAQRAGLAMLPANRKKEGMFSFQPIAFNISVGSLNLFHKFGVVMDKTKEKVVADDMIKALAIKTPSQRQKISALSGGNAQKVVIARQLVDKPDVLVLAEPSQGVDIGAKDEIHKLIDQVCDDGAAVLVATSDLMEALRIADRLIVIRNGTTFTEFERGVSQAKVLAAASGALSEGDEMQLAKGEDA